MYATHARSEGKAHKIDCNTPIENDNLHKYFRLIWNTSAEEMPCFTF